MRARTARRAAERAAQHNDQHAAIRRAMQLVEGAFAVLGPPPDASQIVITSNGSGIWIHRYADICAKLRATGEIDGIRCAEALEALKLVPGSVRVVLCGEDGRWRTARAVPLNAPGGDA
jgi:hypothetical protein